LESNFSYTASDSACNPPHAHYQKIEDWKFVGSSYGVPSVEALKKAIATYGPVAAAVCVGSAFTGYHSGIFSTDEKYVCQTGQVNHAVVLVGWDDATDTWIMKNSWGTGWGESGYMRIKRDVSNIGYAANYVVFAYSPPALPPTPPPSPSQTTTTHWVYLPVVLKDNAFSQQTVIVSKGGTGSGTVTGTGISCGTDCSESYEAGSSVSLTALADTNSTFTGWTGACSGITNPCTLTLNANAALALAATNTIQATFTAIPSYDVSNGDFEKGSDGSWLITSSNSLEDFVIVDLSDYDISNHSGNYAAWLGGDPAEVTTLTQHITVPEDATLLDYWYWIDSNDSCGKSQGTVYLDTTLLKTYDLCQVTWGWMNEQLAIPAEFRGKTSDLIFKAETAPDPSGIFVSSFLLDDVSILGALSSGSLRSPGKTPKTRMPFPPGLRKSARPSAEKGH
jgi:hypothetical protein